MDATASTAAQTMAIRLALADDLTAVLALLRASSLPVDDVPDHMRNLFVAVEDGRVVGAVELEDHGSLALLRSLVVAESHRRRGLAAELCAMALMRASTLGLRDVYLLTETAQGWFETRGFAALPREQAPRPVQHTRHFRELCPDGAVLMRWEVT